MKATSETLSILKSRIRASKKIMEDEKRAVWTPCRDFYEGRHWPKSVANKIHTINLVWSTVRTLLAAQYYKNPRFTLKARKPDFEGRIKELHEAVLEYYVNKALLKPIARSCVQSAFTDLACINWGCDTKFKSGKSDKDSFYFKKIEPERFFPDHTSGEQLFEKLPGFGVAELMRSDEVKQRWGQEVEATETVYDLDDEDRRTPDGLQVESVDDMKRVKVYNYYDREASKHYIFAADHQDFLDVSDIDNDSIPYAVLKYNEKPKGFYPLPEIYHLIDPQKIIEISASMAVEHMKRSSRKVEVMKDTLDEVNKTRLESPETGVIVEVDKPGMIRPIELGSVDSSIFNVGGLFGQYFDQISSINASRRGGSSQKLTATAESIIDKYGMNRANDTISLLTDWMQKIGKGFLDCLQENLTLPGLIQLSDPMGAMEWMSYIPTIDLIGDYECSVQVGETSPKDDQLERAQWIECLGVLQQSPILIQSPRLIKETMSRFQIEDPSLIQEIVQIGQQMMQAQHQAQQQQLGEQISSLGVPSQQGAMMGANVKL